MSKSTPAPVDFKGAAEAEGESSRANNEAQTWANRPDQVNPWGTISWENQPVWDETTNQNINRWQQTQTLSPALQDALQYQMGLQSGRSQLGYGMMGNVAQDLGTSMDWSQFGPMASAGDQNRLSDSGQPQLVGSMFGALPEYQTSGTQRQLDYGNAPGVMAPQFGVDRAENAIYDRGWSRMGQQQSSEQQSMDIKLRNQGLAPGDQAYDSAMQTMGQKHNDQQQQLTNESIMGGGREAQRMLDMESGYRGLYTGEQKDLGMFANAAGQQDFNQQMTAGKQSWQDLMGAAQFQNQARAQGMTEQQAMNAFNQNTDYRQADYYNNMRQQMINEEIQRRGYSLNEVNALISGQQVGLPQMNSFSQAGRAESTQYLSAANSTAQQNSAIASAENAGMEALMGGAGQAAGMFAMSDRRLKRNIKKIGEVNGINWYEYDYVWGEHAIGVMADEVPHAAIMHPSGYLMVDYSKV